jgi:hypothetical protein
MKTVTFALLCFAVLAAAIAPAKQVRFRQQVQSRTREACADLLNKDLVLDEDAELLKFAECNLPNEMPLRAGREVTTPAGFKFQYNADKQFTQGGYKRLFTALVTETKEGFPEVGVEIVIAVSKISVGAAYDQLKAEYEVYAENKLGVGACPGVMKIYEGWTVGEGEERKSFYMIFEKINGKNGKFNAAKFFNNERVTLKEWAKLAKQMFTTWNCIYRLNKYIADSDAKNMIVDSNLDYRVIDLDIKAFGGDETEKKWRRSVLANSLRFAGAKRDCFANWIADDGVKYSKACEGVIVKATEEQAVAMNAIYVAARAAAGGLLAASEAVVLVDADGALSTDAIDANKWTPIP